MEIIRDHGNNIHQLYEASMRGCVNRLNALMQNDPLILHKASVLTSFGETPLHISALLGHLDFTTTLLTHKPELAMELDSLKHSPLHLASASGRGDIVKELLLANDGVCLVADQDGRIPLHLAAMRGRVEVIEELIRAKPDSVREQLHGDTVLHLCVKFNHLDALKTLVASVDDEEFINLKNHQGYTILHLSVTLKQLQTTNYLLSIPQIRIDVNFLMENGLATLVNHSLDFSQDAAVNFQSNDLQQLVQTTQSTSAQNEKATFHQIEVQTHAAAESILTKLKESLKYNSNYFEKARGNLMVVASLIATMSFQVAVNPPGGFWQEDTNADHGCPDGHSICRAGTAIHAYKYTNETVNSYHIFTVCSTISLCFSLSIILLLISGVPLRNKLSVGFLIMAMFISVLFTAATYMISTGFIQAPGDQIFLRHTANYYSKFWFLVLGCIVAIQVPRVCWWMLKKLFRFFQWLV